MDCLFYKSDTNGRITTVNIGNVLRILLVHFFDNKVKFSAKSVIRIVPCKGCVLFEKS